MRKKPFFYIASLSVLLIIFVINYERSIYAGKQLADEVAVTTAKTGVYKGELAKNFQLLDNNGQELELADFLGRKVILNFFASWCAPCQEEMPVLVQLDQEFSDNDLIIISVNLTKEESSKANVAQFLKHFQVRFPVIYDDNGEVMNEYQIIGIPTNLLINADGLIAERINGMLTYDFVKQHPFFRN